MISSLTRDLPIDGSRACVSRIGPAFHGTDIGLRQIPFACCQGDPFDIAWLRHACCSSSQKIDHRAHTPRSMTYGQIPDIVKTLVQKLVGAAGIVGVRMPQSGPPFLTDGQILILKRWIALGAPRN